MIQEMIENLESTFWQDFTIADRFGEKGIKDTFKNAFTHWKTDLVFITELSLVLNWKCWYWYEKGDYTLSQLYQDLWEEVDTRCQENLKGKELDYYFRKTD